jgi:cobalt/nickel transport system permease protein
MIVEDLITKKTILHTLDPRVKLICAVAFSALVAIHDKLFAVMAALLCAFLLSFLSGMSKSALLRRVFLLNGFIALLWVFVPFTFPGQALFSLGVFEATRQGVEYAALITLRANAIILCMITYGSTTSITDTVHALRLLRVPDKLVYLFFLTYRYVHEIVREYNRMQDAMKIRCFTPSTNMHTYKSYAYLVGMLLVNSFERAQRIRRAMICRGFQGKFVHIDTFRISQLDIISTMVFFLGLAGLLISYAV